MSNLPKVLVIMAISVLCSNAMADWQADAAHLSSETGVDTATPINALKNDIDKFMPPQPCIDKNPQTFTLGTPATLSCGSGSSSGGAGGGSSVGGGGSTVEQQQQGSGKAFDIMN
ncbi:MAG: hypothetical protein AB7V32_08325 [Candidatus Berkiella sp.]